MADKPGEYLPPLVTRLKADISDLKKGFEDAKRIQKDYKDDLDGLSTSFDKTKRSAQGAGQEISDFERLVRSKSRTGELSVSAMRAEYDRLTQSVKTLRKTLASQGAGTDSEKTYGELRQALGDLQKLSSIAADFGIKIGDATGKGIANGAAAAGPYVQTAIVAAIVGAALLAAPYLAATLSAALVLSLGAGVVGLAAYILKDDKGIKAAWEKLTETTSGVFQRSAKSMRKPFIETLGWLEREFKKLEKPLTGLFNAARPLVQPLAEGFFGLFANALPGLTQALINAEPAFKSLGDNLPKVGTALGEFFRIISENPEEIALIIEQLMNLTSNSLVLLAYLIAGLTVAYGWIDSVGKKTREALGKVVSTLVEWWNGAREWVTNLFKGLGTAIVDGIKAGIRGRYDSLVNTMMAVVRGIYGGAIGWLEIGSPSKRFRRLGEWTMDGYIQGIESREAKAWNTWAAMGESSRSVGAGVGVAGYDAARASMNRSGAASLAIAAAPVVLQLDGRVIYESTIKYSQRGAARNVSTGLVRAGATA